MSQILLLLSSPILTRIYYPENFGLLAIFSAITAIVAAIATLKLELTIVLPKSNDEALTISGFAVRQTLFVSFAILIILISLYLLEVKILFIYFSLPISIFLVGLYNVLIHILHRYERYTLVAIFLLIQSCLVITLNIVLGIIKIKYGLVISFILGYLIFCMLSISFLYKKKLMPKFKKKPKKKYFNYAKSILPGHFLNYSSIHFTTLLLNQFGLNQAGFYSLAYRVLKSPVLVLVGSMGNVFKNEYVLSGKKKKKVIFNNYLFGFSLLSILFCGTIYLFIEDIITIIFGEMWLPTAIYGKALLVLIGFEIIEIPLSFVFLAEKKEVYYLYFQILLFFSLLAGYAIGFICDSSYLFILTFSILGGIVKTISTLYSKKIVYANT